MRNEWYSTQDNAFTLLAFGKAARIASATKATGKVKVGSKEYAYNGGTQRIDCEPYGKPVTIAIEGTGRVYYTLAVEGIRTDGRFKMEDRNLQVRRDLLNRSGAVVTGQTVKQNDLLVVRITLTSSVDRLEYVAVSDLLPAGLEIENPRLTEATAYPFIQNATVPEYMDIRDDRINLYTSFRGGKRQQVFYYAVRAVTAGNVRPSAGQCGSDVRRALFLHVGGRYASHSSDRRTSGAPVRTISQRPITRTPGPARYGRRAH